MGKKDEEASKSFETEGSAVQGRAMGSVSQWWRVTLPPSAAPYPARAKGWRPPPLLPLAARPPGGAAAAWRPPAPGGGPVRGAVHPVQGPSSVAG